MQPGLSCRSSATRRCAFRYTSFSTPIRTAPTVEAMNVFSSKSAGAVAPTAGLRRTAACWPVLLVAAWCVAFRELLFTDRLPYYRDLLRTYYPLRSYMAARFRAGALPQWYPFENLGEPFIGQVITGVFHPLSLVYLVVDPLRGVKLEVLLCYFAAWAGMALFCRSQRLGWPAVAVGVLAYGLSGYVLAMSNNLPYTRGVAALPWLAWCVVELVRAIRPWAWVAAT
jgi:hypothetical protein